MGFLLIFFPEATDSAIVDRKDNNVADVGKFSPSSSPLASSSSLLRRSSSIHGGRLISRAQSTISICALFVFITLLVFTLSTFEPSSTLIQFTTPRRQLISHQKPNSKFNKIKMNSPSSHALQGMGTLYRRGTKAMNDLIVAHVVESLTVDELRLFLRVFHRSVLTSRSDLLFLFPSSNSASKFHAAILEESDSLLKLVDQYQQIRSSKRNSANSTANFDATQFVKWSKKEKESGEPIWGRRIRSNSSEGNRTESTRLSYGSVVGFDVDELDPEHSLFGFLDHVPMSLRRWACYPMLFGRVRRNFKHTMLIDVKELLIFGDPLTRFRSTSPESVQLSTTHVSAPARHGKRNSERTQSSIRSKSVSPSIIIGGARGVRRLSKAMLTEIVRTSMQQSNKKKNSVTTELELFNQLAGNDFLLKNINLIISNEPIPELSSLVGSKSKPGSTLSISNFPVVRRGSTTLDVNSSSL